MVRNTTLLACIALALCFISNAYAQMQEDQAELFHLSLPQKRYLDSVYWHWTAPSITVKLDTTGRPLYIPFFDLISATENAIDQWSDRWPSRMHVDYGGITNPNTGNDTTDQLCSIFWGEYFADQDQTTEYIGYSVWGYAIRHYHVPSSAMIDADIILNPNPKADELDTIPRVWSISKMSWDGEDYDTTDLESIIVHELGHVLGHDHADVDVTYAANPPSMGTLEKYWLNWKEDSLWALCMRTINYDDWRGLCYMYGDTLRVPHVFYNIEEAFDFLGTGQNILFTDGIHDPKFKNVDTLATKRTLDSSNTLYIMDNTKLVLTDTLIVEQGAQIYFKANTTDSTELVAELECAPGGLLIVREPYGLRGIGNIIDARIQWESDFRLASDDSLTFTTIRQYAYYCLDSAHHMIIDGSLVFNQNQGDVDYWHRFFAAPTSAFNDVPTKISLVGDGALFKVLEGTSIEGIHRIDAASGTQILSLGQSGGVDNVTWYMDSSGVIVNYGTFIARHSIFNSTTSKFNGTMAWQGIYSASESSYLEMDNCHLYGIAVDPTWATTYTGITFVGTGNERMNYIRNSRIQGTINGYYNNNGVMLYPHFLVDGGYVSSCVSIDTSCIFNEWQYGILNYGGSVEMLGSRIYDNETGMSVNEGSGALIQNCFNSNRTYGIYGDNGSTLYFNDISYPDGSFNSFVENGSGTNGGAISLYNSSELNDGIYDPGPPLAVQGRNHFATSDSAYFVSVSQYSDAQVHLNFWGEPPGNPGTPYGSLDTNQIAWMFYKDGTSQIDYAYPLDGQPDETMGCEPDCGLPPPSYYQFVYTTANTAEDSPVALYKAYNYGFRANIVAMEQFARAGNILAAYGLANVLVQACTSEQQTYRVLNKLYQFEDRVIATNSDSLYVCLHRIGSFLNSALQSNMPQYAKNAMRLVLAKTYARYTDISSANSELTPLIGANTTGSIKKAALLLRQQTAIAVRDTSTVESMLSSLYAFDSTSHETAIAAAARRIFYLIDCGQVQQRSLNLPKYASETTADIIPRDIILEQNTPNPFNPSTDITYGIPEETLVKLAVYDNLGREVKVLANGWKAAGTYTVTFDAADLPSGMYLYRIETVKGSVSKKMMLMK